MNTAAVFHSGTYPDSYLRDRKTMVISLRAANDDALTCSIVMAPRMHLNDTSVIPMQIRYQDAELTYYSAIIESEDTLRYLKYYFMLESADGSRAYFDRYGCSSQKPEDSHFEFLYANGSEIVDPPDIYRGQVFYQIFPDRFCNGDQTNNTSNCSLWESSPTRDNYMGGDLAGILKKIPYLESLGISVIYLNPIFRGDFNHKYATTDYYEIDPIFGNGELFSRLVRKLHQSGIRVILDGVFNHTGTQFHAFSDILKNQQNSIYTDWYHIRKFPLEIDAAYYECVGEYPYMPKLNTGNPQVREYLINIMIYWIQVYGIDGWRLDVADEVDERLWLMARARIKELYPSVMLLGETWGSGLRLMSGNQMDSIMNYVFRDITRDFLALEKINASTASDRLQHMLAMYPEEINQCMFLPLDSHDTERFLTLCGEDLRKMKLAVLLQMSFPGAPSVYYGDEIGLTGNNDPDCRKCMVWEKEKQNLELLNYYQKLIQIRNSYTCIKTGQWKVKIAEGRLLCFSRSDQSEEFLIVINAGEERTVRITVDTDSQFRECLTGEAARTESNQNFITLNLNSYEGNIWRKDGCSNEKV